MPSRLLQTVDHFNANSGVFSKYKITEMSQDNLLNDTLKSNHSPLNVDTVPSSHHSPHLPSAINGHHTAGPGEFKTSQNPLEAQKKGHNILVNVHAPNLIE